MYLYSHLIKAIGPLKQSFCCLLCIHVLHTHNLTNVLKHTYINFTFMNYFIDFILYSIYKSSCSFDMVKYNPCVHSLDLSSHLTI